MFLSSRKSVSPARSSDKGTLSVIGPDLTLKGNVTGSGQVHIDGRIDGDVKCDTLIQGESGVIAGHIVADNAHIAGLVDGTVKARVVTLEPTARITGDVTYETLSIAAGGAIEGRLSRRAEGPSAAPAASLLPPAPPAQAKASDKKAKAPKPEEPGLLAKATAPAPVKAAPPASAASAN